MKKKTFKFIDLFAGIGGFHYAMKQNGGKCVFMSEIDEKAVATYTANHKISKKIIAGDITRVDEKEIPDHDILCAGFPCQPFSQAGKKKGFSDTRGTLFFDILRILQHKRPKAFFLENVRGLINHDNGNTLKTIEKELIKINYSFQMFKVKTSDYGLPQNRPRVFLIGFSDGETTIDEPEKLPLKFTIGDLFGGKCDKEIGFTLRVGGRGSKLGDRRNWEFYKVDNKTVRITSEKAKLIQGFPEEFKFPVSEVQAMKQLGNSVSVDVVSHFAKAIKENL